MSLSLNKFSAVQAVEVAAFAPILAALLLGSLPVLLAVGIYKRIAHPAHQ